MNVLVIGGGGREHAIAWKFSKSSNVTHIFGIPGNGGIASLGHISDLPLTPPFEEIKKFVKENKIDLVFVGPEEPLVNGIVDELEKAGIKVFGPKKEGARLEGSKAFAKEFMKKYDIPTAKYEVFDDFESAKKFVETADRDLVIKASGLAAGKGTFLPSNKKEAIEALETIMIKKKFGESGNVVVIEERLHGEEVSVFVLTDGETHILLGYAQDYKRLLDGDRGPNTGGMGSYTPVPVFKEQEIYETWNLIVIPTLKGLEKEGIVYKGILYIGIILTSEGPKVLEYNCRFGDPETQVLLPAMEKVDLYELSEATVEQLLKKLKLPETEGLIEKSAVTVVLASAGYPEKYEKGKEIKGDLSEEEGVIVFHAGTKLENGKLLTNGGRVLNVTGVGKNIKEARQKAYQKIEKIYFEGMQYRKDIAEGKW